MQLTTQILPDAIASINLPLTLKGKAELSGFSNRVLKTAVNIWLKRKDKWPSLIDPYRYFISLCGIAAKECNEGYNCDRALHIAEHLNVPHDMAPINDETWAQYLQSLQKRETRISPSLSATPSYINNKSCDCTPFVPEASKLNETGDLFLKRYFPDLEKKMELCGIKKRSNRQGVLFTCSCTPDSLCDNCKVILFRECSIRDASDHTLSTKAGQAIPPQRTIHQKHCISINTDPYRECTKRYTMNEYMQQFRRRD